MRKLVRYRAGGRGPELVRSWAAAALTVRADADGSSQRVVEGTVVPYGAIATVRDDPAGPRYRETIAPGAATAGGTDWGRVMLDYLPGNPQRAHNSHEGARTVGRAIAGEDRDTGPTAAFRVSRTAMGDEAYELARDGVLTDFSVAFEPVAERRRDDGVIERTAIRINRVAILERGAYGQAGANITAVRAATEGSSMHCQHCGATLTAGVGHSCQGTRDAAAQRTRAEAAPPAAGQPAPDDDGEDDEATAAPPGDRRPNRTRVTVDVERQAAEDRARGLAERGAVADMARGAGPTIRQTRPEAVYGPASEHFFLRDAYRASHGDWEAQQRQQRHFQGVVQPSADAIERAAAWDWASGELNRNAIMQRTRQIERAGDVLSAEIPGAYPTDFVPGLLTPRILKGRPMGDFYDRFPIADARPRTFPKVTTSTSVAVQSAEGAALGATDFATTAVTATPLMYGAYTDVSRQTLDGADPAAQAMLLQDLNEAYAQASETVIKTAVEAGSTASGVAITAATPYAGTLANVINFYAVRFRGATGAFVPAALFPVLASQGDTTGRPFLPMIGAVNSDGTTVADDVDLQLAILTARGKLSYASTANVNVFGRPNDFVVYESSVASFSFDQVVGPQAVRMGIWAYLVVGARLGSLKVTAA